MAQQVLYKYRSLDNWKFVLDIFLNRRLYAAEFNTLNDPMEGRYRYSKDAISQRFAQEILRGKRKWKICSLSHNKYNTLMWAHYSGGHTGIAVGVKVRSPKANRCEIREVAYVDTVVVNDTAQHSEQVAKEILTQKLSPWNYEEEVRVLCNETYFPIYIHELVLGCKVAEADEAILRKLCDVCAPNLTITKLSRSNLDKATSR